MLEYMHASLNSLEVSWVPAPALMVWIAIRATINGYVIGAWNSSITSMTYAEDLSGSPLRKDLRGYLSNRSRQLENTVPVVIPFFDMMGMMSI
jgi:hypothetical protein